MDWGSIFAAVMASGVVTAGITVLASRRKVRADTVQVIQDTASGLIQDLRQEVERQRGDVERVRAELDEVKRENSDLRCWAERLVTQVIELGGVAVAFEPSKAITVPVPKNKRLK